MTWRQLFNRRPGWWVRLASRIRQVLGDDTEPSSANRPHDRTSAERAQFWADFRAGQREADQRLLESRKPLTPCRENGALK